MVIVELNGIKPITDKNGRAWIPIDQMLREGILDPKTVDVVKTEDGEYFEVVGYSDKRKAIWVESIEIDGTAENLEKELEDYLNERRLGSD